MMFISAKSFVRFKEQQAEAARQQKEADDRIWAEEQARLARERRLLRKLSTRSGKVTMPAPTLPLSDLQNKYRGKDIWVLGAAKSMDYVDPTFFDNKIVIALNFMYRWVAADYVVSKLPSEAMYQEVGTNLLASRHLYGNTDVEWNSFNGEIPYYLWDHTQNTGEPDYSVLGTDKILVGKSTMISAIHIAAYMGAKNIILCGVDGGTLDGEITVSGYDIDAPHAWTSYRHFIQESAQQSREVIKKLKEFYGCNIYSLNPFPDFTFDGHRFEPA